LSEGFEPIQYQPGSQPVNSLLLEQQETERILFRKIAPSDFREWQEFFNDPFSHKHWVADREAPEVECEKWYRRQFQRYETNAGGMNALIEKSTGKLIGHCGLLVQLVDNLPELEIGYSLLPYFRGKGYAFEAAMKCRDHAFERQLSEKLISIISLGNAPSQRVAMRNGMTAGKETVYKNNKVIIYSITRKEWAHLKSQP
jgi:ribosomal-protein-alanine N-acetyltransferase